MRTLLQTSALTCRIGLVVGTLGLAMACSKGEEVGDDSSANTSAVACSPAEQQAAAARMVVQAIKPPRGIAGIDLAGGDSWTGLTLHDAERTLCQSTDGTATSNADDGSSSDGHATWGDAQEVSVEYDKKTGKIFAFQLNAGYRGSLDFVSRPSALKNGYSDASETNPFGQHTYSIGLGRQILRDGQPWNLNWMKDCSLSSTDLDCWQKQLTEMFDGLLYTFSPEMPSTQGNCVAEAACLGSKVIDGMGLFGARPLGIYFVIPGITQAQPAASTPSYFYGFIPRMMPFSSADMSLKIGGEGSVATARDIGERQTTCELKLGLTFEQFLANCVEVNRDAQLNAWLKRKALGNATRSVVTSGSAASGTWKLAIDGPSLNFSSERFDEIEPGLSARATELTLDVRSRGKVLNDFAPDGKTLTLAGSASVYREFARLTQKFLHAQMSSESPRFELGASECLIPEGADAATWFPADGCTGMEQFLTAADPSTITNANLKKVSVGVRDGSRLGLRTVLKPGDPLAVFCADPGTYGHCGNRYGGGSRVGNTGPLFTTVRKQIISVLGQGEEDLVPPAAREVDTYVRLYAQALVKYLRAAAEQPGPFDLSLPAFDRYAAADSDITITKNDPTNERSDFVTVKYLDRLEFELLTRSSNMPRMTLR